MIAKIRLITKIFVVPSQELKPDTVTKSALGEDISFEKICKKVYVQQIVFVYEKLFNSVPYCFSSPFSFEEKTYQDPVIVSVHLL